MKLMPTQTAMVVGAFATVMHAIWSLMVLLGLAEPYLNLMLGLHFLNNPFTISTFSLTTALMLIVVTFGVGYVVGYVFAVVWNKLHQK